MSEVEPQLPGFEVLGELGRGARSIVYEARQTKFDRIVAIKVLKESKTRDSLDRFMREARKLTELNHPNVVVVHNAGLIPTGVFEGSPYLILQLVPGRPLAAAVRELSTRTLREKLQAFVSLTRAVQFAHDRGIFHCDLHPHNIMVSEISQTLHVTVIDFGASVLDGSTETEGAELRDLHFLREALAEFFFRPAIQTLIAFLARQESLSDLCGALEGLLRLPFNDDLVLRDRRDTHDEEFEPWFADRDLRLLTGLVLGLAAPAAMAHMRLHLITFCFLRDLPVRALRSVEVSIAPILNSDIEWRVEQEVCRIVLFQQVLSDESATLLLLCSLTEVVLKYLEGTTLLRRSSESVFENPTSSFLLRALDTATELEFVYRRGFLTSGVRVGMQKFFLRQCVGHTLGGAVVLNADNHSVPLPDSRKEPDRPFKVVYPIIQLHGLDRAVYSGILLRFRAPAIPAPDDSESGIDEDRIREAARAIATIDFSLLQVIALSCTILNGLERFVLGEIKHLHSSAGDSISVVKPVLLPSKATCSILPLDDGYTLRIESAGKFVSEVECHPEELAELYSALLVESNLRLPYSQSFPTTNVSLEAIYNTGLFVCINGHGFVQRDGTGQHPFYHDLSQALESLLARGVFPIELVEKHTMALLSRQKAMLQHAIVVPAEVRSSLLQDGMPSAALNYLGFGVYPLERSRADAWLQFAAKTFGQSQDQVLIRLQKLSATVSGGRDTT